MSATPVLILAWHRYPEAWADKSFDNTGLLLEAPFDASRRQKNSVLLTNDLTKAVADEAIERRDSIVVAYHPIIFRALKSLTLANTQQQSLLRLAAAGISVYSPHTAVDAAPGGSGDFLADIVTGTLPADRKYENGHQDRSEKPGALNYELQHHPSQLSVCSGDLKLGSEPHTRSAITPFEHPQGAGYGRIVCFPQPQPLETILARIRAGLGAAAAIPLAIPQGKTVSDVCVSSVGIVAGSGGAEMLELDVDLLFTGELSHHLALAATENGQCVVTLFHSNSERGFLHAVLRARLQAAVEEEWRALREAEEEHVEEGLEEGFLEALRDESVRVDVSERDRDPFGMHVLSNRCSRGS